jgi:hypothetical protein
MTTAKWTSIQDRSRIYAILLQDSMKRGVCRCGVEKKKSEILKLALLVFGAHQSFGSGSTQVNFFGSKPAETKQRKICI